jgi:hypothetical protein
LIIVEIILIQIQIFVLCILFTTGYSDEEYETDPETKVKGPKPAREGSEDSDVSEVYIVIY